MKTDPSSLSWQKLLSEARHYALKPLGWLRRARDTWRSNRKLRWATWLALAYLLIRHTYLVTFLVYTGAQLNHYRKTGDEEHLRREIGAIAWGTFVEGPKLMPSDAEMIRKFREHREDFEQRIKLHRQYWRVSGAITDVLLEKRKEAEKQGKRLSSEEERKIRLGYLLPAWWKANKAERDEIDARTGIRLVDNYFIALPDPYARDHEQRLRTISREEKYQHGVVVLYIHGGTLPSARFGQISKSYIYLPDYLRFEDGRLLHRADHLGRMRAVERLVSTLDWYWVYPWSWSFGIQKPCLLRQIEPPHWYLKLCRS